MRKSVIGIIMMALCTGSTGAGIAAQIEPATLSYQGILTDNTGQPVTVTKSIRVCLYQTPSAGTAFWCDDYTVTPAKTGQFSVVLGRDGNPLTDKFSSFSGETYIGIRVGTDNEMTQRQRMTSVVYAVNAANAVNALNAVNATNGVPPGTVVAFAGSTAPAGWLMCDGSLVSRTVYSNLFTAISTNHGTGDGSTTFNLPDYRGRFLRGVDYNANRDPDKGSRAAMNPGGATGNTVGSVQGDAIKTHSHNATGLTASWGGVHSHTWNGFRNVADGSAKQVRSRLTSPSDPNDAATNQAGEHDHTISGATASSGDSLYETRPENAYINWIIKY